MREGTSSPPLPSPLRGELQFSCGGQAYAVHPKPPGANLEQQGVEVVQVDWTPPAGGDLEMVDLLDELL
jgi:hypothetical protein